MAVSAARRTSDWWRAGGTAARLSPAYAAHQGAVPRLPIPPLADTCARYLRAARPLQSDAEHSATRAAVARFAAADGDGPALQRALERADAARPRGSSYLESLWYRMAYLEPRSAVPIHSNPAVVLASPANAAQREPLPRAAGLLASCAQWVHDLRRGSLPAPVARGGGHMCMSLLPAVLGSSRLPAPGLDLIHHAAESQHAAVCWQGEWYRLRLFCEAGLPLPAPQVLAALERLPDGPPTAAAAAAADSGAAPPVGAFTAWGRDEWANARPMLLESSPHNATSLRAIDDALLALCFDDEAPASPARLAAAALCGDVRRRWYDKLQLLVFANGEAAINFEHSPHDGAQLGSLAGALVAAESRAAPHAPLAPASSAAAVPERLLWELTPPLSALLAEASRAATAEAAGLEIEASVIRSLSLGWARGRGVSLDAVMQLAMQLGYCALTGGVASTYEACSTQAFAAGRTEVIRSVTVESKALVEAIRSGGRVDAQLLAAALAAQRRLVAHCQRGLGHERHMLALRVAAEEEGLPMPAIFTDGGWPTVSTSTVSTSGLRSDALQLFTFGPVTRRGVGLGYLLAPDGVALSVTSWRGEGPPAAALADSIRESCEAMRATVESLLPPPAPRSKL